jgi:hypothetical protein
MNYKFHGAVEKLFHELITISFFLHTKDDDDEIIYDSWSRIFSNNIFVALIPSSSLS